MYLQFRMGADGMGPGQLGVFGRGVMNGLPVVVFLFTMNFPAVSNYSNIFISVSICIRGLSKKNFFNPYSHMIF